MAGIALIGGVIVAGGTGCGSSSGGSSSSSGSSSAGGLPPASCGSAVTHFLNSRTVLLSADPGAPRCFETAALRCEAAGLAVTEMGVDTGVNHVFTISPDGTRCAVTEWSQPYSANGGGSRGRVTSTPCGLGTVTAGGVSLTCAGQPLLIPATTG